MPNSSPSTEPLEQEQSHECDAVFEVSLSLNQETPNQPDPPEKSDPETFPPAAPNLDPEYNSPEEEEEEEEGEEMEEQESPVISSGMPLRINPPITDLLDMDAVTLTSPSGRRGVTKRKKGKGKGKGKRQQAINDKIQTLMTLLNPVPFIPTKILDFSKHEELLKKLCLWEFVHIDFDRTIRVDLIAQLVASYDPKSRASYVNECRIKVNRADLARAFKLPLPSKKERGNVGGVEVDLDGEVLSDDSIAFMVELMSDWVLLHEDMWMMPDEVMDWMKLIKDGHPEKVDWAGLLWLMVEKELKQGGRLKDCYYASHMQHLIKFQRHTVFLVEQPAAADAVDVDGEARKEEEEEEAEEEEDVSEKKNVNDIVPIDCSREEETVLLGPSTELTLGQDGDKEEGTKDVEMTDAEKYKDCDEEVGEEEQGQWLLQGKNDLGEHILQRCSAVNGEEYGSFEEKKDDEEEMEREEDDDGEEDEEGTTNNFHVFPNDDGVEGEGFTGNLLEAVEGNQMDFSSQDQLHNPSTMDTMHHIAAPSFFNNSGKRVIEHDNHISHHSLDENNKRLRLNDSWDNNKPDLETCMEQIHQMSERVRMLYMEKEQALVQTNMTNEMLVNEIHKRDTLIGELHTRLEETQKKDREIFRLERELFLMGGVLDGYRKALKDVQKAFEVYKEKAQLAEEPTYKDTGLGGLMLTAPELEKLRQKQEEDYKMNCLFIEQKMKETEEEFSGQFRGYLDKVNHMDSRLACLEANTKELAGLYAKRKFAPTEEHVPEIDGPKENVPEIDGPEDNVPAFDEPEVKVPESGETEGKVSKADEEENLCGASETAVIPQTNEEVVQAAESPPNV